MDDTAALSAWRVAPLQAGDFIVESAAQCLPSRFSGWLLLTLLEVWKAALSGAR